MARLITPEIMQTDGEHWEREMKHEGELITETLSVGNFLLDLLPGTGNNFQISTTRQNDLLYRGYDEDVKDRIVEIKDMSISDRKIFLKERGFVEIN